MDEQELIRKELPELEKYLEDNLDQELTMHAATLAMLIFRVKVGLLLELNQSVKGAMAADHETKRLIQALKERSS